MSFRGNVSLLAKLKANWDKIRLWWMSLCLDLILYRHPYWQRWGCFCIFRKSDGAKRRGASRSAGGALNVVNQIVRNAIPVAPTIRICRELPKGSRLFYVWTVRQDSFRACDKTDSLARSDHLRASRLFRFPSGPVMSALPASEDVVFSGTQFRSENTKKAKQSCLSAVAAPLYHNFC